jgi:hypothetical protein
MKLLAGILTAFAIAGMPGVGAACPPALAELIEREASSTEVPSAYAIAIAETVTACRPGYDTFHRVGVMGIRHDLLQETLQEPTEWMFYPTVNVQAAMTLLDGLLDEHGDWETVLQIYLSGDARPDPRTDRAIREIFRRAHRLARSSSWRRQRPPLDDFEDCNSPLNQAWRGQPVHPGGVAESGLGHPEPGSGRFHPNGGCRR